MASLNFDATELKIFYGNLGSPSNHILVKTLDIFIKSVISLKTFILQIWVTWASKITIKKISAL